VQGQVGTGALTSVRRALGLALLGLLLSSAPASAEVPSGPRLAFTSWGPEAARFQLLSVDPAGSALQQISSGSKRKPRGAPVPFQGPTWSPDGSTVAFAGYTASGSPAIFTAAADGSGLRVVPSTRGGTIPVLSRDGRFLAFARTRQRIPRIDPEDPLRSLRGSYLSVTTWLRDLVSGESRRLSPWRNRLIVTPASFAPDGSVLGVSRSDPRGQDAVALELDSGKMKVLAHEAEEPVYSPDGSRIAFLSYRDGNLREGFDEPVQVSELYVKPTDGGGLRRITRTPELQEAKPSWDPSGERLAYAQDSTLVMQVNPDGTCRTRVFRKSGDVALFDPAWQPGLGREAGRIAC
jgi:Tol biopolymer transport system component